MICQYLPTRLGSTCSSGSSITSTAALAASARATDSRDCSPAESVSGRRSRRCVRSNCSNHRLASVFWLEISSVTAVMCSNIVRCGHKPPSAGTQNNAIRCVPRLNSAVSFPALGFSNPTSKFSSEVLPAPECPNTAVTPGSIRSVIFSNRCPSPTLSNCHKVSLIAVPTSVAFRAPAGK
jgi:hypothetical protein